MNIEATQSLLTLNTKKKGKKNNKHHKHNNLKPTKEGRKALKKVVNDPDKWEDMKPKKLRSELSEIMPTINGEVASLLHGNSQIFETLEDAIDVIAIGEVQEAFVKVFKAYAEDENEKYCDGIFSVISDVINNDPKEYMGVDKGVIKGYIAVFKKAKHNKKKMKKLVNKLGIPEEMALTIALLTTFPYHCKLNGKVVSRKMSRLWALLKKVDDLDKKDIIKIIQICFEKEQVIPLALSLLNERKNADNGTVYDIVTDAICAIINKLDREKLNDVLKSNYKFIKKKNGKIQCRLNEDCVEDYKTLNKVYKALEKRGFTKVNGRRR